MILLILNDLLIKALITVNLNSIMILLIRWIFYGCQYCEYI